MKNWKKVFAIIWTGQLFSILSSVVVSFSLILWLSLKTESAEVLAMATIAALLPQSLLGLVAGVFIDRWDRKLTMILADSFIALFTLVLAILFFMGTQSIWHIYLLLSLRSVGSAFHSPAMQASIPLLAPNDQLTRIAGISQIINSLCNIAGPAMAALLIVSVDISYILLLDVVGAAIACTSLLFVKIPNPERVEQTSLHVWKDLREAIQGVRKVKGLVALFMLSVLGTFVIMPVSALFPLMTLKHFLGDALQISIIEAVWGAGMLVGGSIMGIWAVKNNKVILLNAMYLTLGFSFLASGLLPPEGFWIFVALSFIGGISGSVYYACFTSIIQIRLDPAILGRVFSVYGSLSLLPSMVGLLATGFIADTIGMGNTFVISGIILMFIGIVSYFFPRMIALGDSKEL